VLVAASLLVLGLYSGMNDQIPVNHVGLSCLIGFWQEGNATLALDELQRGLEWEGRKNFLTDWWPLTPSLMLSLPIFKKNRD
jgi:hypothetical protein